MSVSVDQEEKVHFNFHLCGAAELHNSINILVKDAFKHQRSGISWDLKQQSHVKLVIRYHHHHYHYLDVLVCRAGELTLQCQKHPLGVTVDLMLDHVNIYWII